MATQSAHARSNSLQGLMSFLRPRRGMIFGAIIILALSAFELFNYSTTDFALHDLLGNLQFAGLRWSTILAIAFCGIDFAGIARLFTPEQGADEPAEVWYLFGAWLLAATMNAMLTWWGVSIAILHDQTLGNAIIDRTTLLKAVPVFVAVMVWLSRVLIIGTFSVAGDRLFVQARKRPRSRSRRPAPALAPARRPAQASAFRPNPKPAPSPQPQPVTRQLAIRRPVIVHTTGRLVAGVCHVIFLQAHRSTSQSGRRRGHLGSPLPRASP